MRLLLDELYSKTIAERLRDRGHDVVAVNERPDLEGALDDELFRLAALEQRAIVTENWADYERLIRKSIEEATTHYGVIFTSRRQLPRSRETIGLYVRVLDAFLAAHRAVDALHDDVRWLPEHH